MSHASLRLASFNLLSGRSLADGRIETAGVTRAITELGADVLALQEVDRGQPRSGRVHQAEVAAAAMDAPHWTYAETVSGTPGENGWAPADGTDPAGPGYGIALLSRVPVLAWHELRLTAARGRYPIPVPGRPPRMLWLRDEPRVMIAAVLAEPRITVACTHLSFVPGANARQLRLVRRRLAELPGPHLLLGDLNLPSSIVRRVTGWTPLVSAPTFPAPAPRTQLDHVLAGELPEGSRAEGRAVRLGISDHRAVVVDLTLRTGPAAPPDPARPADRPAAPSPPSPRRRTRR